MMEEAAITKISHSAAAAHIGGRMPASFLSRGSTHLQYVVLQPNNGRSSSKNTHRSTHSCSKGATVNGIAVGLRCEGSASYSLSTSGSYMPIMSQKYREQRAQRTDQT